MPCQPLPLAVLVLMGSATPALARQAGVPTPPTAPTAPPAPPATRPAADLPKARTIVDRAVKEMGGRKAVVGVETLEYKVTVTPTQAPVPTEMVLRSSGSSKMNVTAQSPAGPIEMGRIGKVAWTKGGGMGYMLVPEQQLGQVNQLDLYGLVVNLVNRADAFETVGRMEFEGRDCHKVRFAADDTGVSHGYFAVEDGLLWGLDQTQPSPMGEMLVTTRLSEYTEFAPLKLFTKASMDAQPVGAPGGPEHLNVLATMVLSDVKFNTLTPADFEMPDEVRDLVEGSRGATSRPAPPPMPPAATRPASPPGGGKNPLVDRMLKRLEEIEDVGQLNMMATLLEGQIPSLPEADQADMKFLVGKIRERIAELESGDPGDKDKDNDQ